MGLKIDSFAEMWYHVYHQNRYLGIRSASVHSFGGQTFLRWSFENNLRSRNNTVQVIWVAIQTHRKSTTISDTTDEETQQQPQMDTVILDSNWDSSAVSSACREDCAFVPFEKHNEV